MFPDGGGYWRHQGSGQPAALKGDVHLVYAQHGIGADAGDVYYIRSTDTGQTFSAPLKLNTDVTTRPQWQPSLSVGTDGSVFATWYDARESNDCAKGDPSAPCYRKWGRKSTDSGASWLADMPFSDVVSPLPDQPDPGIVAEYASDYDYGSSVINQHLHAWVTDGSPSTVFRSKMLSSIRIHPDRQRLHLHQVRDLHRLHAPTLRHVHALDASAASNPAMKPTSQLRNACSVFGATPCRGLSLCR